MGAPCCARAGERAGLRGRASSRDPQSSHCPSDRIAQKGESIVRAGLPLLARARHRAPGGPQEAVSSAWRSSALGCLRDTTPADRPSPRCWRCNLHLARNESAGGANRVAHLEQISRNSQPEQRGRWLMGQISPTRSDETISLRVQCVHDVDNLFLYLVSASS